MTSHFNKLAQVSLVVWISLVTSDHSLGKRSNDVFETVQEKVERQRDGDQGTRCHNRAEVQSWSGTALQAPCHLEREVVELFNQLVVELNISEPGANESCSYVLPHHDEHHQDHLSTNESSLQGNHSGSNQDDHHEKEKEDSESHREEPTSTFCAALYSLTRQMLLSLNYTTLSCLENGTVEEGVSDIAVIPTRPDPALAYGSALLCILFVSSVSLAALVVVPFAGKESMSYVFAFLVAMGISALVSDAILHLIPKALFVDHEDAIAATGVIWKCSALIATTLALYIFEFLVNCCRDTAQAKDLGKSSSHSRPSGSKVFDDPGQVGDSTGSKDIKSTSERRILRCACPCGTFCKHRETSDDDNEEDVEIKENLVKQKDSKKSLKKNQYFNPNQGLCRGIVPVAWIIIFGDAFHNFADGIAIGAAFAGSMGGGLSTSLAILFHEIPHEFGDYAILLSTGMKWYIAVFYNLASAMTAVVGVFIGVAVGNSSQAATTWIFIVAAGIFLYVALVDMLPSLNDSKHKGRQRWIHFALHLLGFLFAYGLLAVLAVYEQQLKALIVI